MTARLPIRPRIENHEDIAAYLQRCATANDLTFVELTGTRRHAQVWETPSRSQLEAAAFQTETTVERLREAALTTAFAAAKPARTMTGRRYSGVPAKCPRCEVDTVAARLAMTVLCPRCNVLLADQHDPHPLQPPAVLRDVQTEVLQTVARARRSRPARERLARLESLMKAQEWALWRNWPALLPGEATEWRERVMSFTANHAEPGQILPARPPALTAELMALTWQPSATPSETSRHLDNVAYMSETWAPPKTGELPAEAQQRAADELRRLANLHGLRFSHIPTTIRHQGDSIVLPRHLQTTRAAQAIAMAAVVHSLSTGATMTAARVVERQGHKTTDRVLRLATRMIRNRHMWTHFAAHASVLHSEGLLDLERLRGELRSLTAVPRSALTALPPQCLAVTRPTEIAAAWVWLDATQGRLAGGPYPAMSERAIRRFDRLLNPEGRLTLREWWQERTEQIADQPSTEPRGQRRERSTG